MKALVTTVEVLLDYLIPLIGRLLWLFAVVFAAYVLFEMGRSYQRVTSRGDVPACCASHDVCLPVEAGK